MKADRIGYDSCILQPALIVSVWWQFSMGDSKPPLLVLHTSPWNHFREPVVIDRLFSLTGTYTMCLTLEMVPMWSKETVTAPLMTTSGTMLSSPGTTVTLTAWKWTRKWSLRLSMAPKTWIWKVNLVKELYPSSNICYNQKAVFRDKLQVRSTVHF